MENQQEINQVATTVETKRIMINIINTTFNKMIADCRDHPKDESTKVLNPKALNIYLAKELSELEHESIKIIHKSSLIKQKKEREDSKYFIAYGSCGQTSHCKVSYTFVVQHQPTDDKYTEIQTDIKGK